MKHARAASMLQRVRQRLAAFGEHSVAIRRALEAAKSALAVLADPTNMGRALQLEEGVVVRARALPQNRPLWIIGDVRNNTLALATALAFIDEADGESEAAFIAFLGDWTGGFCGDAACVAMVLERLTAHPGRTLLLRGDREWALNDAVAALLESTVAASGLHSMSVAAHLKSLRNDLVHTVAQIAEKLPVAVVLADGTVLAHGALPRASRLRSVKDLQSLQHADAALRDFVLGRLHLRENFVNAAQREGGVICGVQDFRAALRTLSQLFDAPLDRMIRGQDAAPEGYRWFRAYGEGAVLTLTTMADTLVASAGGGRRRTCVGRLKGGRIRVARIELPDDIAILGDQLFPRNIQTQAKVAPMATLSHESDALEELDALSAIQFENEPTMPRQIEIPPMVNVPAEPSLPIQQPVSTTIEKFSLAETDLVECVEPHASLRNDPAAAAMHFQRGIALLRARSWAGARDAFRIAGVVENLRDAAAMNEAVACLWLGTAGHQEALSRLRELRQRDSKNAAVHFNMAIAFLGGEKNPSEAMRSLRAAVDAAPDMADAWWALGLAAAMRSDSTTAASAFARAASAGCPLPIPGSMQGLIPVRELAPALDALRSLARHRPSADAPAVSLG